MTDAAIGVGTMTAAHVWVRLDRNIAEDYAKNADESFTGRACREALDRAPVVVVTEATARAWVDSNPTPQALHPTAEALYDELAAQLQPPKPRYEVKVWNGFVAVNDDSGHRAAAFYGPTAEADADEYAAKKNGEQP